MKAMASALLVVAFWEAVAAGSAVAGDIVLAEGRSWPGTLWLAREGRVERWFTRSDRLEEGAVPRVQSVTVLSAGRLVFCSGLDRMLYELLPMGERRLRHGGYLARQVRTDLDGTVYWSGLETPLNGNPLPDGFIYSWTPSTNESRTVLTFSQEPVGRDWWGAFEVRDGRVYAGTLRDATRVYEVTGGLVRPWATLPMSVTAFRFGPDGRLWACNGQGALYRFTDPTRSGEHEVVLNTSVPFTDFAFLP